MCRGSVTPGTPGGYPRRCTRRVSHPAAASPTAATSPAVAGSGTGTTDTNTREVPSVKLSAYDAPGYSFGRTSGGNSLACSGGG
jgi:hypothetical protein